jgi:hypothetical protein
VDLDDRQKTLDRKYGEKYRRLALPKAAPPDAAGAPSR